MVPTKEDHRWPKVRTPELTNMSLPLALLNGWFTRQS